jgi:hypothetical protein
MHITNLLSEEQRLGMIVSLNECTNIEEQSRYGRYVFHDVSWDIDFKSTIMRKVQEITGKPYKYSGAICAEYTAKAGDPNLPPHFDGDQTDLILTYQIESNKQWGVGVDLTVYNLEDSDAVMFHPNENIHWRPHAKFEDGEFVRVMFLRLTLPQMSDYSHKALSMDDPIFDEVKAYRDSL